MKQVSPQKGTEPSRSGSRPRQRSKGICFVVSPIGGVDTEIRKRSNEVLHHIIRPAAKACGYQAVRADEVADPGIITSQVIRHVLEDPLVIADLTDENPNVMYELAVRHAVGKPFIQICLAGRRLPFDIAATRVLHFPPPGLANVEEIKKLLVDAIHAVESATRPIETPIGRALDLQRLQTSERLEARSLAEVLSAINQLRAEAESAQSRVQQFFHELRHTHEGADSVYQWRAGHYKREKEHLAAQFARQVLGKRVSYLRKKLGPDRLRLVFDSGSTIAPLFDVLGRDAENSPDHWCRGIPVVTNNIKGIENILRYRDRPGNRYANLPLSEVSVLPGKVLAAFEAIADPQTLDALEAFRDDGIYTIAVTTGNYILLDDGMFLPIARAGYHPHFKATLYDVASEVYVVAPLGKILMFRREKVADPTCSLDDVLHQLNGDLGLRAMGIDENSEGKQYHLVSERLAWSKLDRTGVVDPHRWLAKSVLVTTRRTEPCLFFKHFEQVEAQLRRGPFDVEWEVGSGPRLWSCPFLELPLARDEQFAVEVPHENLRRFAERYFWLSEDWSSYDEAHRDAGAEGER